MNPIDLSWMHHPLMFAIGQALVHFLWQGLLIWGGAALALRLNRQASPHERYRIYLAALVLIAVLPISTAALIYDNGSFLEEPATLAPGVGEIIASDAASVAGQDASQLGEKPVSVIEAKHAEESLWADWQPLVVLIWMIGVFVFFLRLMNGHFGVRRLKKTSMEVSDEGVLASLATLIKRMNLRSAVLLRISETVEQPVLIGWLRPVILLPASMLTALPPDQIEAILVHELVHIRRHDYLVLLVQSVVEVLFFYHPAVWWISRQMRIEREFCCDREALDLIRNESIYARALLGLEITRSHPQKLALGAQDGRLVDRILHISRYASNPSSKERSYVSWMSVVMVLFIMSTIAVACSMESGYTDKLPDAASIASSGLVIDEQFGIHVEMPEDWIFLSEDLNSFLFRRQMFSSPDTQIVVFVERFLPKWLNEEDMRTWKDGVKLRERGDVHTFIPVDTWAFKESEVRSSKEFAYPQGMNVFWAESDNWSSYAVYLTRGDTFTRLTIGGGPDLREEQQMIIDDLLESVEVVAELPEIEYDVYMQADEAYMMAAPKGRDLTEALALFRQVPPEHPMYEKAQRRIERILEEDD